MKTIIYVLLFCLSLPVYGQMKDFSNARTSAHINIPGTRLFIIPPPAFKVAGSFIGLQNGECGIQIYDLVGGNYYTNGATFSKAAFEEKGIKVAEYGELNINGFPAKYATVQPNANFTQMNIVFGDTTFSVMIIAIYPSADKKVGDEVNQSLLSISYDKSFTIDPFASASFTLDDSGSKFKFSKMASGFYIYTLGGVEENVSDEDPQVSISKVPVAPGMTFNNTTEMFMENLEKYGLTEREMMALTPLTIHGKNAQEAIFYGKLKGDKTVIYLLLIHGDEKVIVFMGIARTELGENLAEFTKLAQAIKVQ